MYFPSGNGLVGVTRTCELMGVFGDCRSDEIKGACVCLGKLGLLVALDGMLWHSQCEVSG